MSKDSNIYTSTCSFVPYPLDIINLLSLVKDLPPFTRNDLREALVSSIADHSVPFHCRQNYSIIIQDLDNYIEKCVENRYFEVSAQVQNVNAKKSTLNFKIKITTQT